jgi:hypothetical protein
MMSMTAVVLVGPIERRRRKQLNVLRGLAPD